MSEPHSRRWTRQGGFTLIELLVVVLIIGILASIAIPAFLGQKRKAQDQAAKSIVRSGVIASESYYAESANQNFTGMVPALLADHEQNVTWTGGIAEASRNELQVQTYGPDALTQDRYVLASRSKSGTTFIYYRAATGAALRCSGVGDAAAWGAGSPAVCGGVFAGSW